MGYLDRSIKATFKKEGDGRLLFFPWGALARGYVITSDDDFERMRSLFKVFSLALLFSLAVSIALAFYIKVSPIGFIPVVIATIFYGIWAHYNSRGLHSLSMRESLTIHSREISVRFLWFSATVWALIVLSNMFKIISKPGEWLLPLISIVIFGHFAVIYMRMLFIRRRHQTSDGA